MATEMKLSTQAIGAIMMALQKSLMEQTDIVPVFEGFKIKLSDEGLVVINPPLVKFNEETAAQLQEEPETQASEG
jgi:hypothetical protein